MYDTTSRGHTRVAVTRQRATTHQLLDAMSTARLFSSPRSVLCPVVSTSGRLQLLQPKCTNCAQGVQHYVAGWPHARRGLILSRFMPRGSGSLQVVAGKARRAERRCPAQLRAARRPALLLRGASLCGWRASEGHTGRSRSQAALLSFKFVLRWIGGKECGHWTAA